jgi:hypothetical protein
MKTKFNPTNRKALAKAIAEILDTESRYQGVKTMSYQIGNLVLTRDGTLEGDLPFGLLTALAEQGFLIDDERLTIDDSERESTAGEIVNCQSSTVNCPDDERLMIQNAKALRKKSSTVNRQPSIAPTA